MNIAYAVKKSCLIYLSTITLYYFREEKMQVFTVINTTVTNIYMSVAQLSIRKTLIYHCKDDCHTDV